MTHKETFWMVCDTIDHTRAEYGPFNTRPEAKAEARKLGFPYLLRYEHGAGGHVTWSDGSRATGVAVLPGGYVALALTYNSGDVDVQFLTQVGTAPPTFVLFLTTRTRRSLVSTQPQ